VDRVARATARMPRNTPDRTRESRRTFHIAVPRSDHDTQGARGDVQKGTIDRRCGFYDGNDRAPCLVAARRGHFVHDRRHPPICSSSWRSRPCCCGSFKGRLRSADSSAGARIRTQEAVLITSARRGILSCLVVQTTGHASIFMWMIQHAESAAGGTRHRACQRHETVVGLDADVAASAGFVITP
jgi:hypothetical protein